MLSQPITPAFPDIAASARLLAHGEPARQGRLDLGKVKVRAAWSLCTIVFGLPAASSCSATSGRRRWRSSN
jgi:hypothetical protein